MKSAILDELLSLCDWSDWESEYHGSRGQPPIPPSVMARVILYGLIRGVRSSRKLEYLCGHNVDFYVAGGNSHHRPQHAVRVPQEISISVEEPVPTHWSHCHDSWTDPFGWRLLWTALVREPTMRAAKRPQPRRWRNAWPNWTLSSIRCSRRPMKRTAAKVNCSTATTVPSPRNWLI